MNIVQLLSECVDNVVSLLENGATPDSITRKLVSGGMTHDEAKELLDCAKAEAKAYGRKAS